MAATVPICHLNRVKKNGKTFITCAQLNKHANNEWCILNRRPRRQNGCKLPPLMHKSMLPVSADWPSVPAFVWITCLIKICKNLCE